MTLQSTSTIISLLACPLNFNCSSPWWPPHLHPATHTSFTMCALHLHLECTHTGLPGGILSSLLLATSLLCPEGERGEEPREGRTGSLKPCGHHKRLSQLMAFSP